MWYYVIVNRWAGALRLSLILQWGGERVTEKDKKLAVNSLALLLGDYAPIRKYAGLVILKILLPKTVLNSIMAEAEVYPFDRKDKRVAAWRTKILSAGSCTHCGSTDRLEAHHVHSWADFPLERVDALNGLCLCQSCHAQIHIGEPVYHLMIAGGGLNAKAHGSPA
jgi:5-methylcytosine-specific restriction endonuclease McrA